MNKKGFTLIELLVVISIIALLLSILMPSLSKVRDKAKDVLCLTNFKQWSYVWAMYTGENNDKFHAGRFNGNQVNWMTLLEPYYTNPKLLVCSFAKKPINPDSITSQTSLGDKNHSWGVFTGKTNSNWDKKGAFGSYGINSWICNPPSSEGVFGNKNMYWRSSLVSGADKIPLIAGSWFIGGRPVETNSPPEYDGHKDSSAEFEMGRFCLNRHNKRISVMFLDGSARLAGLKELWKLKWHAQWNSRVRPPAWSVEAPWMTDYKDY